MAETLQQERVARGLCPRCGAEAAPYYLCGHCRYAEKLRRICNRFSAHGLVTKTRQGRAHYYQHVPGSPSLDEYEAQTGRDVYREPGSDDGRLRPRLRGIPVEVDAQLRDIFEREGRPLTEAEVSAAWGRLRVREGRVSAASDLAALIRAERKRKRKYGKDGPSVGAGDSQISTKPLIV